MRKAKALIISSLPLSRLRLAQLSAHLVVAVIALVVVGGATRVMEAGLACPDWPLCYGAFFPGLQMNLQVFLEWFHRLDAFLIGIALVIQVFLSFIWRSDLPRWVPISSLVLVVLVSLQGVLGALTVKNLLPSGVVTAHLGLGLILVASLSATTQALLCNESDKAPIWWRLFSLSSSFAVIAQCLIGGKMATSWSAQQCINNSTSSCAWVDLHRISAIAVTCLICLFVAIAFSKSGWPRTQWPLLISILLLVAIQIGLGLMTFSFGLSQPLLTVGHQLVAALLVAILSALSFRRPQRPSSTLPELGQKSSLEPCHG